MEHCYFGSYQDITAKCAANNPSDQSGPISARLTLPRTAFVPGETVPIAAEADNKSSREVKSSSVKLVQTITYHAQGRSEVGTHVI